MTEIGRRDPQPATRDRRPAPIRRAETYGNVTWLTSVRATMNFPVLVTRMIS